MEAQLEWQMVLHWGFCDDMAKILDPQAILRIQTDEFNQLSPLALFYPCEKKHFLHYVILHFDKS